MLNYPTQSDSKLEQDLQQSKPITPPSRQFKFILIGAFTLIVLGLIVFSSIISESSTQKKANDPKNTEPAAALLEPSNSPTPSATNTLNPLARFMYSELVKQIGDSKYTFIPDKVSGYYFDLATVDAAGEVTAFANNPVQDKTQQLFASRIGALISDRTTDFWIDFESKKLFIVDSRPESADTSETILEITFSKDAQANISNKRIIAFFPIQNVWERTEIVNYYPDKSLLLMKTHYGDGCGGGGRIWTLATESTSQSTALEYGMGCQEGPLFGGFTAEGDIIAAKRDESASYSFPETPMLTSLFLINPFTGQQKMLVTDPKVLTGLTLVSTDHALNKVDANKIKGKILLHKIGITGISPETLVFFDPTTGIMKPYQEIE